MKRQVFRTMGVRVLWGAMGFALCAADSTAQRWLLVVVAVLECVAATVPPRGES